MEMRRLAAVVVLVLAFAAQSAAAGSWAQPQIRLAVSSGLMGPSVATFRANDPLTRAELAQIVAGITREEQVVEDPTRSVTMTELNSGIVRALGLAPAAQKFRGELGASGLRPPRRTGWEIVARLLKLRFNHPAERDNRELLPNDAATRAEAAYSVAQVLALSEWDLERVVELAGEFDLQPLTEWQRRVLERATRFVGYPYAWGGTSESRQTLFGVTSRGGFDCSGFVWRVYRLEPWADAPRLNSVLRGRTSYQMSGEVRPARRVAVAKLRPADVVFFGARGPRSTPGQVNHMGMYVGAGWFVHSSGQGTTLAPLQGWYRDRFAWGRRPLAEAALE
jgi:cell wall-associated NlpC family hydrolase